MAIERDIPVLSEAERDAILTIALLAAFADETKNPSERGGWLGRDARRSAARGVRRCRGATAIPGPSQAVNAQSGQ
ncbi:MAG: hypothetical protein ACKVQA_22025 [Burkholderiales bacterium]